MPTQEVGYAEPEPDVSIPGSGGRSSGMTPRGPNAVWWRDWSGAGGWRLQGPPGGARPEVGGEVRRPPLQKDRWTDLALKGRQLAPLPHQLLVRRILDTDRGVGCRLP